ncbi:sulfatase [Cellulophaga sp. Hel_I_12]|uniref:sulfatase n=1 Tax=Cellulophaga sp. Hel_I_12 TaxID=1249972 RepID=UPI000689AA82|nr:sulfatase [Cellulophaga sp. Hel_I_12]
MNLLRGKAFRVFIIVQLFIGAVVAQNIKQEKKKNIVFILADDLGWMDLSSYGSDFYETPNLDALAKEGMLFTNAYAASPLCSPTRASILTGQEPGRLRFTTPSGHVPQVVLDPKETYTSDPHDKTATPQTRTRLPNDYLTFAEVLKENGYSNAFMGKWHLGSEPYIPENQGFDVVVGGREHPGPPGPGHFFSPWNCETLPVVPEGTHISDVLTDEAISYMTTNKDNPFLLCLWYYDVHAPFQAKRELIEKYQNKLNPSHIQRSPTMAAMIETMDINVGRVVQTLKDLQLEDETIIIFTSDNGGNMYDGPDNTNPTNNYPLRAGKGNNYEGGVRVPLIIKVPGVTKEGSTSKVVTSTVDHYASLLELLSIPFPENLTTDGVSYVKALKGEDYERAPMYSTFAHNVIATGNRANISMRQGSWRLYKFYFDGPNQEHRYELYNLDDDIGETNNLADIMQDRVKKMQILLDAHAEEAAILLPNKNQNYDGNSADAWWGSTNTQLSVLDKILHIEASEDNPKVETVYTPNVSKGTYYLTFEMKSSGNGEGTLAWKTGKDKDYIPENKTEFEVKHDNQWHQYKIEIPLSDRLSTIQIQPSQSKGKIQIKNIELVNEDGYYIRDWPLY